MNDYVMKKLEDASYELLKAREEHDKEDADTYELMKELEQRAYQNGARYIKEIFKNIIKESFDDPRMVKVIDDKCEEYYDDFIVPKIEFPAPNKYQSQDEVLAKLYNEKRIRGNSIYFLRRGKHSKNKNLPVKFDMDKIEEYNLFEEFVIPYHNLYQVDCSCVKVVISRNKLYDLALKAYSGMLTSDGYLLDDYNIEALRRGYLNVLNMQMIMKYIMEDIDVYADIIYNRIYEKLATEYVNNPGLGIYSVNVDCEYGNEEHQKIINIFDRLEIPSQEDKLLYLKFDINDEEYEYVPVFKLALENKFANSLDKKFGYLHSDDSVSSIRFNFDGNKIGKFMDNMEKNVVKKRVKEK